MNITESVRTQVCKLCQRPAQFFGILVVCFALLLIRRSSSQLPGRATTAHEHKDHETKKGTRQDQEREHPHHKEPSGNHHCLPLAMRQFLQIGNALLHAGRASPRLSFW